MAYRFMINNTHIWDDELQICIPCDPANADYAYIVNNSIEVLPYEAPPAPVPTFITKRQFYLQAKSMELWDSMYAWIQADTDRAMVFQLSSGIERADPMVAAMGTLLDKTTEEIDAFFTAAAQL